jgi:hypothetical protein
VLGNLCFAFYFDTGSFLKIRVPIRRREDTEGDRNLRLSARALRYRSGAAYSCFKIQLAGVWSLVLENPSNRSKTIRKESRKNFLAPLGSHLENWGGQKSEEDV